MFDESSEGRSPEEVRASFAWLDRVIDHRDGLTATTEESVGWVGRIRAGARVENQAAGAQLVAIGELFGYRLARSAETADWAVDTEAAVAGEVGAGLRISQALASSKLRYARALRERLPKVGEVFCAGDIDFRAFTTIVYRTDNITDPRIMARVDKLVAAKVRHWPSLTKRKLSAQVDKIVARVDADAVRRRTEAQAGRDISIWDGEDGISYVQGTVATTDAHAFDRKLNALAATVCPHDPRSREERRADAMGALGADADRLGCRCGRIDCAAGTRPPAGPVVIHVIAEQATLDGTSTTPACEVSADGLITPELVQELAKSAKLVPLIHPGYAPPEPRRRPSQALTDFVRCRDLTCRWPGCDVPAVRCDADHTIPWSQGGPTHAANLKCYCRTHHLMKTFWGWHEKQLADGTLILTSPAGDTHVTTPGSALLFPSLCGAVGGMPSPEAAPPPADHCGERAAMMPTRRRTRTQDRAHRIATERRHNRAARKALHPNYSGPHPPPPNPDDEPPPF